jgi:hypothetical protein
MANYITTNRLNSALSKIGRLDFTNEKRLHEIKKEFQDDIFYDFNNDNANILGDLDEPKIQWLRDRIAIRIAEFITTQ